MKKAIVLTLALAFSGSVFADDAKMIGNKRFVINEEDAYAQLCLAALESKYYLEERARQLGVSKAKMNQITCNGLSLVRFAKTHRGDIDEWFVVNQP